MVGELHFRLILATLCALPDWQILVGDREQLFRLSLRLRSVVQVLKSVTGGKRPWKYRRYMELGHRIVQLDEEVGIFEDGKDVWREHVALARGRVHGSHGPGWSDWGKLASPEWRVPVMRPSAPAADEPPRPPSIPVADRLTIGVVTGSRADFGLLHGVIQGIRESQRLSLRLFVTGMHLAPEFGETWREIEEAGFAIDRKVDMLLSGDSTVAVTKSTGLGVIGFADAFEQIRPDLVLVLGDRFEILAAVQACLLARIPVAHIAGGDITEGAVDESIRHAITKMSHLHFATNAEAAARVRQMGENPDLVFHVGSPGIDFILNHALLSREELAAVVGLPLRGRLLAVTFHPATLDPVPQDIQMRELLAALDTYDPAETEIVFTMSNADAEGRALMALVSEHVRTRPNAKAFTSLGQTNYLSLIAHADAVVGNSSSGLYEAPTLKTPTVNIGDRQKGRLQASSVINCPAEAKAIAAAIRRAFDLDARQTTNPYGDGNASAKIVAVLESLENPASLLQKPFFPLP